MTRTRAAWIGAMVCVALAAWQAERLVAIGRWNRAIAAGRVPTTLDVPPEVRFAAAYAAAERGAVQEALNGYRELQGEAGERLRHAAMFNSGTLYLQQAMAARKRDDQDSALILAQLAKASFRELLREDSGDWDARYNLEKTLRLAPDAEAEDESLYTPPSRLHKAPTGPGTSLGLP